MGTMRWNRGGFVITRHPMPRVLFELWLAAEGRPAMRAALRNTRARWLFGEWRARRRLHRAARTAFRPRGVFSETLRKHADGLPAVIRACGQGVRALGYTGLCTYDGEKVLAVVPRAIVQNDFRAVLLRDLSGLPQVKDFAGLTERVITSAAADAEAALFDHLEMRAPLVDETGRGLVVDVDRDFPWKLGPDAGHYYYAWATDERADLTLRRERRRFLAALEEALRAQCVHLKRMPPDEIADLRNAIELRRLAGAGPARARVRVTRETVSVVSEPA